MKFLLNMNTPRALGVKLIAQAHACRHVGDIGMARASDTEIVQVAKANAETVITHDLDYGNLLAFSGEASPSVIIFRMRNNHPNNLYTRMMLVWREIAQPLEQGAIVVLEDATLRIRRLPIVLEDE